MNMYIGLTHQIAHQSKDNLNNKSLIYLLSYQCLIDYFYICSNTFNTFWKGVENNGSCRNKIKDGKMTKIKQKPLGLN
jgi:hypothetical protein